MIDFKVLISINKNAISSMKSDSEDEKIESKWKNFVFYTLFYFIPIVVAAISWYRNINLSSLENFLGASISIFTGLFFSLLISIGSKIRSENENPNKDEMNYNAFKKSMKQISNITLYIIILGIIIFLLMFINSICKSVTYPIIEKIISSISLFYLAKYIVSLCFMMQRFYYVVRDELNNII